MTEFLEYLSAVGNPHNHIIFIVFGLCSMVLMFANLWAENEGSEIGLGQFLFGNTRKVVKAFFYFATAYFTLAASGVIDSQVDAMAVMILAAGTGAGVARDFNKLSKPKQYNIGG